MSEAAAAAQNDEVPKTQEEEVKGSEHEAEGEDAEEEEAEDEQTEEENFINNHDLIGVKGIIAAQKNEIEKKKVSAAPHSSCEL